MKRTTFLSQSRGQFTMHICIIFYKESSWGLVFALYTKQSVNVKCKTHQRANSGAMQAQIRVQFFSNTLLNHCQNTPARKRIFAFELVCFGNDKMMCWIIFASALTLVGFMLKKRKNVLCLTKKI